MTKGLLLIAVLAACVLSTRGNAQAPAADTILVNGKVVTLDGASSVAQAVAIRDGKILATGSNADIPTRADSRTHIVHVSGRTVIPRLMHSHIHALRARLT